MYIKKYESFSNEKRINEEFIGSLVKGLKNKLSLGFSKMFGSSKEADNLIKQYAQERYTALEQKKAALKTYAEYIKSTIDGGEKDPNKLKTLQNNLKIATTNYDKSVELIRKKFDIKFNEIIEDEKNKKIQNYINLKKIELEQDLLMRETNALLTDSGLSEKDRKANPEFDKMLMDLEQKLAASKPAAEKEINALNNKETESGDTKEVQFPIQKAKEANDQDKIFIWEESPFKEYKFKPGEKITYWSKTYYLENKDGYSGTEATIQNIKKDWVSVKVPNLEKPVEIRKTAIMKSKFYDKKGSQEKAQANTEKQEENK